MDLQTLERDGISVRDYKRRWWSLAILNLSLIMVVMGNSSVNVAIPTLVRDLGASNTELQWIVDAYALVFGGLLLTMGALGDRFGRKGALMTGLVVFGLAPMAVALWATDATHIIIGRAVMGIGAALIMPATLSILTSVFPREERGKAIGIWAAFAGIGGIIGIVSSGWLLEHYTWNAVFWINVPIVAIAMLAGFFVLPTSRDPHQAPLDIVGSVLSILGIGGLLYAIIEGPEKGWTSALVLGTFAAAALTMVLFVLWERRSTHPMLPMSFFGERGFNVGTTAIAMVFFGMMGLFFVMTQYMQFVKGWSPLQAGLRMLPMALGMMMAAPNADRLSKRLGARWVVTTGLVLAATGMAIFAFLQTDSGYGQVVTGLVIAGFGMGLTMAPSTTTIMSSIPASKAGVGSSMNDTSREVGGAFGIAILGTILKDIYVDGVQAAAPANAPPAIKAVVESGLGGALAVAQQIGGPQGAGLAAAAKDAFVDAMLPTFLTAAGIALAAAIIAGLFFPSAASAPRTVRKAAPLAAATTIIATPAGTGVRPRFSDAAVQAEFEGQRAHRTPAAHTGPVADTPISDTLARLHARIDALQADMGVRGDRL